MGKSRIFYFIKYTVDCVRLEMMPPFLREIAKELPLTYLNNG